MNHKNLIQVNHHSIENQIFFSNFLFFKAPLSYSQSPSSTTTTTIDLSQNYSSQQMNINNQNDYSSLQPRHPVQPPMNVPRQRPTIPNSKTNDCYSRLIHFYSTR